MKSGGGARVIEFLEVGRNACRSEGEARPASGLVEA